MISAQKAKHLNATTMFTYSHANTPLSQSERAYYLSYFIIITPVNNSRASFTSCSQVYCKIPSYSPPPPSSSHPLSSTLSKEFLYLFNKKSIGCVHSSIFLLLFLTVHSRPYIVYNKCILVPRLLSDVLSPTSPLLLFIYLCTCMYMPNRVMHE